MTDENKNVTDAEDFDLRQMPRRRSYAPPLKRDTEACDITDSTSAREMSSAAFRIPPDGRNSAASRQIRTAKYSGASFNRSRPNPVGDRKADKEETLREYTPRGPYIKHVTVRSWPNGYSFYEKFVKDAVISHGKAGSEAPHVPFFSYIPQYQQLTASQWAYYLYMKAAVREGICLADADFSYVLLYIYEIINLDGVISPAEGASLLGRVWAMYRRIHPTLDKYMAEWMADYCLIYGVPMPQVLRPVLPEIAAKSGIREFFVDEAMADPTFSPGQLIRLSLSDYSPNRSRYARTIENFASYTEEVFDAAVLEQMRDGTGVFSPTMRRSVTVTRDAFCGSLCSSSIKKRITLELDTCFRSPDVRRVVTEMMKGAENIVRSRHGVKARLNAPKLMGSAALISAATEEEREYLSYYESPTEPFTAERAAEIESVSWRNTEILTDDTTTADDGSDGAGFEEPVGAVSSDDAWCDTQDNADENDKLELKHVAPVTPSDVPPEQEGVASALMSEDERLRDALAAVMNGESFSTYCREHGMFADDAASRINDIAMDILGDVILEAVGTDYTFVEDYRQDIQ